MLEDRCEAGLTEHVVLGEDLVFLFSPLIVVKGKPYIYPHLIHS